jgi:hypothetical protein
MARSEKALMRKIRPFVPPGANVVAVAEAHANPIDELHRATPVALTEHGLLLITSTGFTGIVTYVAFIRVSEAHAEGAKLFVSFRDEHDRPRTFDADFGRGGTHIVERFLSECRAAQPGLKTQDQAPVASYHVAWDGARGATFDVYDNDRRRVVRSTYDDGVSGVQAAEMCKQATMEVTRAIADRPELVWVREKPGWMPEFVWTPPLPETPPQVDRRREPRDES